ncbi:MAG TPA: molecular chaperone HtpG [Ktedonobacteraceae bacterium]|jgi:molecular chaperone HtpG
MAIDMQTDEKEVLRFQAEVTQLLDIMIHSLYSNKEIFLRELISNASDALDRLHFAALLDPALLEGQPEPAISLTYEKATRTITVSDNGIGMSREEVAQQIGTIARSGTREFFQTLSGDQQKDASLIGQFGVGFYSSFVVAERVILTTRRAGQDAAQGVRWESDGKGSYTLQTCTKETRGTEVMLVLREGEEDFLTGPRLRAIVRKYSDHISVPIFMPSEQKDATGNEQVNQASALWLRPKQEISEQAYTEFYRYIAHALDEPLLWLHSRMEGTHEYTLLLYVPTQPPYDLWSRESRHAVKLYVRRILIMETHDQLLPRYLRFVRGIIDSNDLPLNVSRELLQHNRLLDSMRSTAVKKILGELSELAARDNERYLTFWKAFGRVLKEGITEDQANRETLATLCRFASTQVAGGNQVVSLDEYKARMKEGQEKIYYLIAENYSAAKESPLLEVFQKKGVEVLLWWDPVDTLLGTELLEYKGTSLQSLAKGVVDLSNLEDEQEREERRKSADESQGLLDRLRDLLEEKVNEVRITSRLTTSPACLIVDEYGMDPTLQRLLQSSGQGFPQPKPILEVNPQHPLIQKMRTETDEQKLQDLGHMLYDQSVLSRGDQLENPAQFVNRLNALLTQL